MNSVPGIFIIYVYPHEKKMDYLGCGFNISRFPFICDNQIQDQQAPG